MYESNTRSIIGPLYILTRTACASATQEKGTRNDHPVGSVTIYVHDQDRAKQFYTEKLGFELRMDMPMWPGAPARWLAVAPPGAATEVVLLTLDEQSMHFKETMGKTQAMIFSVQDMNATMNELTARGVHFTMEPATEFWGTWTLIEDSEGNQLMLVEPSQM